MKKLLVVVGIIGEEVKKPSLEVLSEAKRRAVTGGVAVEAVTLGPVPEKVREKVLPYVGRFVSLVGPTLDRYTPQAYTRALAAHARETQPDLILAGATLVARDFLPRVAVALNAGIASDVTEIEWGSDPVKFVRPMYGGRVLAAVSFASSPAIVCTRPNSLAIDQVEGAGGEFVERAAGDAAGTVGTRILKVEPTRKGRVDITEAEIIVSGGRGLKAAENFRLLEELAYVVGATVGASRSAVDANWRDQEDQVGKSGKTVSPKLYIAAGISGAIHHVMGMDTSKVILAINTDPNANIFNYADYGITGNALEVIPAMTAELKKRLGKA